jgi:gamma-glutamylcysteine synthetase
MAAPDSANLCLRRPARSTTAYHPAEEKLELFHGRWRGRVDPVFAEFAY